EGQFGGEHDAGGDGAVAAEEDAERDAHEVPGEEEGDTDDGDDEGGEGTVPEVEPVPPVEQQHAARGGGESGEVERAHRHLPFLAFAVALVGSVLVGPALAGRGLVGPALWSPRIRLSTSSALMRHMGSPTPGAVVAPA